MAEISELISLFATKILQAATFSFENVMTDVFESLIFVAP